LEKNRTIFDKFIDYFNYGNHTYIFTHGKDKEDRKNGFPLDLNKDTEIYITNYILSNRINTPYIHFIKGDLHQSQVQNRQLFRYKNVRSLYGSTKWAQNNHPMVLGGYDYEIVDKVE
jgi:hypothetical protein